MVYAQLLGQKDAIPSPFDLPHSFITNVLTSYVLPVLGPAVLQMYNFYSYIAHLLHQHPKVPFNSQSTPHKYAGLA